jgi:hypothetical protein
MRVPFLLGKNSVESRGFGVHPQENCSRQEEQQKQSPGIGRGFAFALRIRLAFGCGLGGRCGTALAFGTGLADVDATLEEGTVLDGDASGDDVAGQ